MLPFASTVPMSWASAAPNIAGLPVGYTEAETVLLLLTGERPHGQPPARAPMPPYRFNRADDEAVVAYLNSVAPRD
jgi:hypothetical protein